MSALNNDLERLHKHAIWDTICTSKYKCKVLTPFTALMIPLVYLSKAALTKSAIRSRVNENYKICFRLQIHSVWFACVSHTTSQDATIEKEEEKGKKKWKELGCFYSCNHPGRREGLWVISLPTLLTRCHVSRERSVTQSRHLMLNVSLFFSLTFFFFFSSELLVVPIFSSHKCSSSSLFLILIAIFF